MKDDKRLKRKVRNSYIVSTVSITLVLFLLGSVGYLMVAALKVADTLQESIAVTVELKNGLSEAQKETISKRLTAEEMVATIAYSAKEEKAEEEEFRKMFGSSFEEILPENPLLDSFELTLTSASSDKELLDLGFIAVSPHVAAMLIVFPLTFFPGFWLNRHVAFRRSPLATGTQLFRYLLSVAGSVVVNYLFLKFFVELCGFWATPSQMMASLGTMVYSYLAAKYFTFRNAVRE